MKENESPKGSPVVLNLSAGPPKMYLTSMLASMDSTSNTNKYRQLVETLNEGIWVIDKDDCTDYVNPCMSEMIGYKSEEMFKKSFFSFIPQKYLNILKINLEKVKKGEKIKNEVEIIKKTGEIIYAFIFASPITDSDNNYIGAMAEVQDITVNKKISRALQEAKEEAEAANISKSDFLASMSHEIRTPLTTIIGTAELLWKTPLTAEQQKYIQIFETAGESLLALIDSILDISKVENDSLCLDEEEFNLIENIEKTCNIMSFHAEKKNIKFACTINHGVPINLIGDMKKLNQILFNLLGNAIKFTEKGKVWLEIKPEMHEFSFGKSEKTGIKGVVAIQFCVSDTGIGISQDKVEMIFRKFTQVDSTKTRKYGGTGLGLAISKRLANLLGGDILVKSELGKGSSFFFTLPFAIPAKTSEKVTKDIRIKQSKLNILIAEDDKHSRIIFKEYFRDTPYKVDTAENGKIAFEKFISKKYDLVFMDIHMPVMDGFTCTKMIRDHEIKMNLLSVPIIALTASALKESVKKSIEYGFDDYITKPVKSKTLIQVIYDHTGKKYKLRKKEEKEEDQNNKNLIKDLIPGLLRDIKKDIDILNTSISMGDFDNIAGVAHKIKGAACIYGLGEVIKISANILKMARKQKGQWTQNSINQLSKYVEANLTDDNIYTGT